MATLNELNAVITHINTSAGNPNAWRDDLSASDFRIVTELQNSPTPGDRAGAVPDTLIGALRTQHPALFSPTGQMLYPAPKAPAPSVPTTPSAPPAPGTSGAAGEKPVVADPAAANPGLTNPGLTPPTAPAPAGAGGDADQKGAAVEAAKKLEAALKSQNSAAANADRTLGTAVLNAKAATDAGKRKLLLLQQEIEQAVTQQTALDTPMGVAAFQQFLLDKHREILNVVADADLDSTSKSQIVAGLSDLYAAPAPANTVPPATPDMPGAPAAPPVPPATPPGDGGANPPADTPPPAPAPPQPQPQPQPQLSDEELASILANQGLLPAGPGTPTPPGDGGLLGGLNPATLASQLGSQIPQIPQMPFSGTPNLGALSGIPAMFGAGASGPQPGGGGLSNLLEPKGGPTDPPGSIKPLLDPPTDHPPAEHPSDPGKPGALLDPPPTNPDKPPTTDHPTNNEDPAPTPGAPVPAGLAPPAPPASGPTEVHLPNGQTITAPNPQWAAISKAVTEGTPIGEAYRHYGITEPPPPGAAVPNPEDPSKITMGAVGQFTDHQIYALSRDLVVDHGQIRPIAEAAGPGFLGWLPAPEVPTAPSTAPITTTTAAVSAAPAAPPPAAPLAATLPATPSSNNLLTPQRR